MTPQTWDLTASIWARPPGGTEALAWGPLTSLRAHEDRAVWVGLVELARVRSGHLLMATRERLPRSWPAAAPAGDLTEGGKGQRLSINAALVKSAKLRWLSRCSRAPA
jgi:hypothetical protein